MASIERYAAKSVFDPPTYSQGVKVSGAQTILYIAGQVAYDDKGGPAHPGDFASQACSMASVSDCFDFGNTSAAFACMPGGCCEMSQFSVSAVVDMFCRSLPPPGSVSAIVARNSPVAIGGR